MSAARIPDLLRVALLTEVFFGEGGEDRLRQRLTQVKYQGGAVAILPELPLDPWVPAGKEARTDDAELPGGRRHEVLAAAAEGAEIAVVGGAIVAHPISGRRHNTALVFAPNGELLLSYSKLHLPDEEGFWEAHQYDGGDQPPAVGRLGGVSFGVQICSDIQRPEGGQMLAAQGAEVIFVPRCTPKSSYRRWRKVLEVSALTSAAYVISVNRPHPEAGVPIGGASLVVAPNGELLLETTDAVALIDLELQQVRAARLAYPGYLPLRAAVYRKGWEAIDRARRVR